MKGLIELLERAAREGRIALDPPEATEGPAGLRELVAFASGCHSPPNDHEGLRWVGPMESEYLQDCPDIPCMDIGHDGCGNAWVLLFDSRSQPAQVLFACHDPALLLVAHACFEDFVREWIEDPRCLEEGVNEISKEARSQGITREQGLASNDAVIREFAASLDNQRWIIHDLRDGNRWFERDAIDVLRKHPDQLVFARIVLEEPPQQPWWKRWF